MPAAPCFSRGTPTVRPARSAKSAQGNAARFSPHPPPLSRPRVIRRTPPFPIARWQRIYRSLALALPLALTVPAAPAEKWDWGLKSKQQIAACDQYLAPVFELYRTAGIDPALARLDETYALLDQSSVNTRFMRSAIWWQAQTQSGEHDEEWGLALFNRLLERQRKLKPETATRIPWTDYLLLGNIIAKNHSLGKAARARAVTLQLENSMRQWKSFDTTCASYADLGPIFSFLPDARIRDVPIHEHQLPEHARENHHYTEKDYIIYAYPQGIFAVAQSAQLTGNWVNAAELYYWVVSYADAYTQQSNPRRVEIIRFARDSYKHIADIAILHGYPGEAARLTDEYIAKLDGSYKTGDINHYDAALKRCDIRRLLGTLTEEDLVTARKAEQLFHQQRVYDRSTALDATLSRIHIQHALGHTSEAWAELTAFLEKTRNDPNPHHRIRGIKTAIDMALADGATHRELESWLVRALDYERRMGNKFNELPLYEKYARFLIVHGRLAEAERILAEAVRLAAAMNLPKRLEQNRTALADIARRHADAPIAGNPAATPAPSLPNARHAADALPEVDLQPRESLSVALAGQPALGRFYLLNPSARPATGTLRISGRIGELTPQADDWLTTQSQPDMDSVVRSRQLTLEPGGSFTIETRALPPADGSEMVIDYSWETASGHLLASQWTCQTGAVEKRATIIDAHAIRSNPFHLIPIHHSVQRTDATKSENTDFSVKASTPTRIECYADDGTLLAIDANGNGSFLDSGDLIASDQNRNNWPDFTFKAGQSVTSLVLFVDPLDDAAADSELALKLLHHGQWQTDAIDRIETGR
ncbi:MAG: hypothetical protein Q7R22_005545 [Verrucomicrobiota bacterium JB025]|nr:hypothetical protein [Verrucomicrobiota bacterium JB025]